jgi:hypothetical protein
MQRGEKYYLYEKTRYVANNDDLMPAKRFAIIKSDCLAANY